MQGPTHQTRSRHVPRVRLATIRMGRGKSAVWSARMVRRRRQKAAQRSQTARVS